MTALLRAPEVTKHFGDFTAVDDVSMHVDPGEVVGLLGANGAGKTTLIRMLLGLLPTSDGSVELLGGPPNRLRRRRLGYVSQGLGLYDDLTVRENLAFVAEAYGVGSARSHRCPRCSSPAPWWATSPSACSGSWPSSPRCRVAARRPGPRRADLRRRRAGPLRPVGHRARAGRDAASESWSRPTTCRRPPSATGCC